MEQGLNHSNVSNLKHDDQTIIQPIKVGEDDWGRNWCAETNWRCIKISNY